MKIYQKGRVFFDHNNTENQQFEIWAGKDLLQRHIPQNFHLRTILIRFYTIQEKRIASPLPALDLNTKQFEGRVYTPQRHINFSI